ncbi:MAG: histidine phosphatase family protein [Hyphomonadaceae bacterium]|nr:histidine phosphatase family protein [Hyphomonadaceae bacterium]
MTDVWVYRHAESLSNAGAKTLDPEGIPLTENGHAQAAKLAASLVRTPQRIIASPFRRSLSTAAPILGRFPAADHEIWPTQEFTYLAPDTCVGTSWIERKPRIDAYWARLDPELVDGRGAESFSSLLGRAREFLKDLAELTDDLVIAVSHGQFMQATRLMAETPQFDDQTAMTVFRDRQAVREFANCERMVLKVKHGAVRAVGV